MQLRPTFSESWYRVKNLKAKLRASAQISRQYYRGDRWYVVRDPAGNQYHRLSDPAYRFVGLLDGKRTVGEAWDLAGGSLADDAPTQPEVIQILSHLYSANLIDADVTPDAAVLLRRHKKQQQRKMQGRLMNILFPRIPLWDPDRFLRTWMPVVGPMISKIGAILWLAVMVFAIARLAPEWGAITEAAKDSVRPHNWMWLWAVFVLIKLIHELGHAFACRRFGGECHEMGIMFLVFIPTPYVDASSAWSFPNKWHRIFVGAGGMIVELFVAAVIALIWLEMDKTTLAAQLMFNAMLVASVSTVVFNANPLLRYDGYYILSDWLEIPNLRQKSSEYTLGLIKRHVFRVKQMQPLPPVGQRVWLFFYSITASVYRVFVGFMIMLLVYFQIPVLGVLMAIGGLITWLMVPVYKTTKYLLLEPELHRKRPRAIAFTVAVVTAVVILVGLVRFPVNIDETGVIEPANKVVLRGQTSGFVTRIGRHPDGRPLKDGDFVKKGQVLWFAENKTLDTQVESYKAQIEATLIQLRGAQENDPLAQRVLAEKLAVWRNRLGESEARRRELTVVAPIDGQLVAPHLHEMAGRYLAEGQEAAVVADMSEVEVVTLVEQRDSEQVIRHVQGGGNFKTEVRPAGRIYQILNGTGIEDRGPASIYVAHPALTELGGEEIPLDRSDPSGRKMAVPQFELRVKLSQNDMEHIQTPGQKAYVRFKLGSEPLIEQWGRRFWQLIQQENRTASWM
jgi:putative peptide zinc metalloprotease protein